MNLEELVKKYAGETVANKVIVKIDGVREIVASYDEAGLMITDRGAQLLREARTLEFSSVAKEAAEAEKPKPKPKRAPRKPKVAKPEPAAEEAAEDPDSLFDFLGDDDATGSD